MLDLVMWRRRPLAPMTHIRRGVLWILIMGVILDTMEAEFVPYGRPVLLDEVKELHFHKGRDTSYKRSPPLPQLRCTRGCEFEPDVVRCKNIKPRGRSSRWQCETNLPSHLNIDDTDIICEGFRSDEDEEVLEGSCALEYTLTHAGWALYSHKGAMAFDPKMKGWSASWIVITAVVSYLSFHIYNAVNWIQEFKAFLVRLRLALMKARRWLQGLEDKTIPISAEERACCRFNTKHKKERNGSTHEGPHCPDHCPDINPK